MMNILVAGIKQVLKSNGSAVFILQPNSFKVGSMRLWLWKWLVETAENWNLIQDVYWWNNTALPTVHCQRRRGLLRPSVKYCLWFGERSCYRNQDEVLWTISDGLKAKDCEDRALRYRPSGYTVRNGRALATATERGGTTPFNLLPISTAGSSQSKAGNAHPARTPERLASWWVRYACPPGGTVLDPFAGVASIGVAAVKLGRSYLGIEAQEDYCKVADSRLTALASSGG